MRRIVYGRPQDIDYVPRTHAEKLLVLAQATAYNARHREPGQHIGPITRTMLTVLNALLFTFLNNKTGDCFPSYATIADSAGCSEDTVYRAISILRDAEILDWDRCFTKRPDRVTRTWKVMRTSNAYLFARPANLAREVKPQNPGGTFNQVDSRFLVKVIHRLSTTLSTRERRLG